MSSSMPRTVANTKNVLMVRLDFCNRPCQRSYSDPEKFRKRGGTGTYGARDALSGTDTKLGSPSCTRAQRARCPP